MPAVSIVTEPFVETGREMAATWSVPDYRFLAYPHPIANLSEEEVEAYAESLVEPVLNLLMSGSQA